MKVSVCNTTSAGHLFLVLVLDHNYTNFIVEGTQNSHLFATYTLFVLIIHESRFVSRALRAISCALEAPDRLIYVLQACCLLEVLFDPWTILSINIYRYRHCWIRWR